MTLREVEAYAKRKEELRLKREEKERNEKVKDSGITR